MGIFHYVRKDFKEVSEKRRITQEQADTVLNMLIDTMNEEETEKYSRSKVCKKIESFLHPVIDSEDFVSLTDLARTESNENPSYVIKVASKP